MTRKLLTGNSAASWGARLARVDYIPAFPITPQTEIIEDLAFWIDRQEMDARLVMLESVQVGATAGVGACRAVGKRWSVIAADAAASGCLLREPSCLR